MTVSRPWRLTRQAEQSLVGIARWTFERFGAQQAQSYQEELIERCQAIADGRAVSQSCALLAQGVSENELRFARAGEHFVVFLDETERVIIVEFLHSRCDLPRWISSLSE